ncbi:MAG: cation transporter [Rubinisphaera brasiliensis]|uniref:cation transporter n=1 Tax=Rubinisphaera TaxID=1649490 RepID=UPI000C0D096E|nr:cation transporter [Rubinisphaera sp.]MBR9801303.1 cation transporter [bacterium]MBV10246.1 cation transporter [Rubinisphaera sp.]
MNDSEKEQEDHTSENERRTLIWVLLINFSQALLAGIVGFIAQSTGLLGAGLDNLGDSFVYFASLYAVGRSAAAKSRVAKLSGVLLVAMAVGLVVDVIRRFISGSEPIGWAMIVVAIINAASNLVCLRLLRSHRDEGVHLNASWIFTTNDMIANLGIVLSGIAVILFQSQVPDLVIGVIVAGIVVKGGFEILSNAKEAKQSESAESPSTEK